MSHSWEEISDITVESREGYYDVVKCTGCGIVARRYEGGRIMRQSPWRTEPYATCEGAQSRMAAKGRRRLH